MMRGAFAGASLCLCLASGASSAAAADLPPYDLHRFMEAFGDMLFRDSALETLQQPFVFPPTISILDVPLSHVEAEVCRHHQWTHQVEEDLPKYVRQVGSERGFLVGNASADFVLVPHCLGYSTTTEYVVNGSWPAATRNMRTYVKAWVGALRRVGPKALAVVSLMLGRYAFPSLKHIPYLITYTGASDWMARNVPQVYNDSKEFVEGCISTPTTNLQGKAPFHYASSWPQDVIIQAPPALLNDVETTWRNAGGRDLLFSFVGSSETHCLRAFILKTWQHSEHQDVFVSQKPPEENVGTYSKVLQRSKYCLTPDGHAPWSYRLLEVLSHGCVPVIVSRSWHPPFHRLLRWGEKYFPAVFVDPAQVGDLRSILLAIPQDEYDEMAHLTFALSSLIHPTKASFFEMMLAELVLVKHERERTG